MRKNGSVEVSVWLKKVGGVQKKQCFVGLLAQEYLYDSRIAKREGKVAGGHSAGEFYGALIVGGSKI